MILEIFLESWKRTLGFNLCCRPPPLPSDLPLDRAFSFMRPLYHIWTNPCEHLSPQTISVFRWGLNEGGIAWKLNRFISTSAWSVHLILVWPLNLLVMALCHYKTKVVLFHCHVWGGFAAWLRHKPGSKSGCWTDKPGRNVLCSVSPRPGES